MSSTIVDYPRVTHAHRFVKSVLHQMSLNIATDLLHGWLQSLELWVSQYGPRFGRCEHNKRVQK